MDTTILAFHYTIMASLVIGADTCTRVLGYISNQYTAKFILEFDVNIANFINFCTACTEGEAGELL